MPLDDTVKCPLAKRPRRATGTRITRRVCRSIVSFYNVGIGGLLSLPLVIGGWLTYTRTHNPQPSSGVMVVFLVAQIIA